MSAGVTAGLLVGAAGTYTATRADERQARRRQAHRASPTSVGEVPFRGAHQAGIITPARDRMHFVALDVITDDADVLRDLLTAWTAAAERMTPMAPRRRPVEVGGRRAYGCRPTPVKALDLPPSGLTVTIGYGPSLFDKALRAGRSQTCCVARASGLYGRRPGPGQVGRGSRTSRPAPTTRRSRSTRFRNLIRMGLRHPVSVRWSQLGFGRTSSTSHAEDPRTSLRFQDGTNNLMAEDGAALDQHVWIAAADVPGPTAWAAGGSYLVARRIRMHIEVWDRTSLQEQEDIFGRGKLEGASHWGRGRVRHGRLRRSAHGRAARQSRRSRTLRWPSSNLDGVRILQRGYNFTDGSTVGATWTRGSSSSPSCATRTSSSCPCSALAAKDVLNRYI